MNQLYHARRQEKPRVNYETSIGDAFISSPNSDGLRCMCLKLKSVVCYDDNPTDNYKGQLARPEEK